MNSDFRGSRAIHLTPSCTDALEMFAILAGVGEGDEVIMPSFTFSSTANAFALRGARPVFVDIRPDSFCLDERLVPHALTPRTKAVVVVRYGGARVDIEALRAVLPRGVLILEDAAHACPVSRPEPLFSDAFALSFHRTKHVTCGEGGALLIRNERLARVASVVAHKGTDYADFIAGRTAEYSWRGPGSSFSMPEAVASVLAPQLEGGVRLARHLDLLWREYDRSLARLESTETFARPDLDAEGRPRIPNVYPILLSARLARSAFLDRLRGHGVDARSHYFPLHLSEGARRVGARVHGALTHTEEIARRLVRLPLWGGLRLEDVAQVARALDNCFRDYRGLQPRVSLET